MHERGEGGGGVGRKGWGERLLSLISVIKVKLQIFSSFSLLVEFMKYLLQS